MTTLFHGRATGDGARALPFPLAAPLDSVAELYRYSTESGLHSLTDAEFRRNLQASEDIAKRLVESLRATGCLKTDSPESCAEVVLEDKGAVLFGRPLTTDERGQYAGLVRANAAGMGGDGALVLALQAMLLSPQFLFRSELGQPVPDKPGVHRLTTYEVASAIAYALTDAPADEPLWQAAKSGALADPAAIATQVKRLSAGSAAVALRDFPVQHFQLGRVMQVPKAMEKPCVFGRERLLTDARALVDDIVKTNLGRDFFKTLLTTTATYYGCDSAEVYGLGRITDSKLVAKVNLPATERAGLLTHPAFLVGFSAFDESLPVRRGHFVNESLLCRHIPEIPIGVIPQLPPRRADETTRERLAQHAADPSCGACHQLMDPIGLAFETYEHWGKHRTMEAGRPVNASGTLIGTDVDGRFEHIADLSRRLATSPSVERCLVRHGFRYFLGRADSESDACTIDAAAKAYANGGDFGAVLATLFTSSSFLDRNR